MKKIIKLVTVLSLALLLSFMVQSTKVEAATDLKVNIVDVLDDQTLEKAELVTSNDGNEVFKFTLEKPSIVRARLTQTHYGNGAADAFITADEAGKEEIVYGSLGKFLNNDVARNTVALEAGTYYLRVKGNSKYYPLEENGQFTIKIIAKEIERTFSNNTTTKKAVEIKPGKDIKGFLTPTIRNEYYKFTLSKKSRVVLTISQETITEHDISYISLLDSKMKEISGGYLPSDGSSNVLTKDLTSGTYYIQVKSTIGFVFNNLSTGVTHINLQVTPFTLDAPKVNALKAGNTIVSGSGQAGAEVFVVCNEDTFIGTIGSNGKYSVKTTKLKKNKNVKVYMISEGIKSKIKTVKVK